MKAQWIIGAAAIAMFSLPAVFEPASAQRRTGGDGERAYELACTAMWLSGNLAVCRELPYHPCRASNPERPSGCELPRVKPPGDQ